MNTNKKKKKRVNPLKPLPYDCKKCIHWKSRCRANAKPKAGKCKYFCTLKMDGYMTTKEEREAILAHNRAIDARRNKI